MWRVWSSEVSEIDRRKTGEDPAMHRASVAAIAFSILWSLRVGATDGIPEVSAQVPPVEEVLVKAPEPRYVAPTLRDRIARVWVPCRHLC